MKIRSKKHREYVSQQPCIVTGIVGEGVQAHHLLRAGGKGLATKACDSFCIPLYHEIHSALHNSGNEVIFFTNHGIDYETVKQTARSLALASPDKRIREINN